MDKGKSTWISYSTISSGHNVVPQLKVSFDQDFSWPALFTYYSMEYFLLSSGYYPGGQPSPGGAVLVGTVHGGLASLHCKWNHGDYTGGKLALLQRPAL